MTVDQWCAVLIALLAETSPQSNISTSMKNTIEL
jgi:hypothetical protein